MGSALRPAARTMRNGIASPFGRYRRVQVFAPTTLDERRVIARRQRDLSTGRTKRQRSRQASCRRDVCFRQYDNRPTRTWTVQRHDTKLARGGLFLGRRDVAIPVIAQAKIQAKVLVPLVKLLQAELGEERAQSIVRKAIGGFIVS